jgi:hypothetical protein
MEYLLKVFSVSVGTVPAAVLRALNRRDYPAPIAGRGIPSSDAGSGNLALSFMKIEPMPFSGTLPST